MFGWFSAEIALGLALEPLGERALDRLDGDVAIEADVAGAIHVAHAAGARGLGDLVGPKASTGFHAHVARIIEESGALRGQIVNAHPCTAPTASAPTSIQLDTSF